MVRSYPPKGTDGANRPHGPINTVSRRHMDKMLQARAEWETRNPVDDAERQRYVDVQLLSYGKRETN